MAAGFYAIDKRQLYAGNHEVGPVLLYSLQEFLSVGSFGQDVKALSATAA